MGESSSGQIGQSLLLLRGRRHYVARLSGQASTFELDGDVIYGERVVEPLADVGKDGFALVHVHVRNASVATKSVMIAAERPDVDIVNFVNTRDGENGASDFFDFKILRTAFEQDVSRIAKYADAGPENEQADGEAKNRVEPVVVGVMNDDRADDDGDVGEGVAEIVDEDAAEVEVLVATHNSESDTAIDAERGDGSPDHPALDDFDGRTKTIDGFITKPERKNDEEDGVCECS